LIVFEGGDASGKSTQAARLARRLGAVLTREPGGTTLGEEVRALLLEPTPEPIDARAELLLMVAARAQHVALRIRPALEEGRTVVCDRFNGSTIAYQGYGRGLPLHDVRLACTLGAGGLEPDVVVLLDVDEEVAAQRRRGDPDRIEAQDLEFHSRVRAGFLALAAADPRRWVVVDGSPAPDQVEEVVVEAVEHHLGTTGQPS
jgi:dTMP kinase